MLYYFYSTAPGLQRVGIGITPWGAMCDATDTDTADMLTGAVESLSWSWHKIDDVRCLCADLVLKSSGEIIGRVEQHD